MEPDVKNYTDKQTADDYSQLKFPEDYILLQEHGVQFEMWHPSGYWECGTFDFSNERVLYRIKGDWREVYRKVQKNGLKFDYFHNSKLYTGGVYGFKGSQNQYRISPNQGGPSDEQVKEFHIPENSALANFYVWQESIEEIPQDIPNKYQHVRDAYERGEEVQFFSIINGWIGREEHESAGITWKPSFSETYEWRVKPKMREYWFCLYKDKHDIIRVSDETRSEAELLEMLEGAKMIGDPVMREVAVTE